MVARNRRRAQAPRLKSVRLRDADGLGAFAARISASIDRTAGDNASAWRARRGPGRAYNAVPAGRG